MFRDATVRIVVLSDIIVAVLILFHVLIHPGKCLQFYSMGVCDIRGCEIIAALRADDEMVLVSDVRHTFQSGGKIFLLCGDVRRCVIVIDLSGCVTVDKPGVKRELAGHNAFHTIFDGRKRQGGI